MENGEQAYGTFKYVVEVEQGMKGNRGFTAKVRGNDKEECIAELEDLMDKLSDLCPPKGE